MSKLVIMLYVVLFASAARVDDRARGMAKFNYESEDCVRSITAAANDIYRKYLDVSRTKNNKLRELYAIMKNMTNQLYALNENARNDPALTLDLNEILITYDGQAILCTHGIASEVVRISNKAFEAYAGI